MAVVQSRIWVFALALALASMCAAATFGSVVPISGNVSDIALDEARGRLYAANFGAYRVEVVSAVSKTLLAPIAVKAPPSAVAVSPDGHYLVIGEYEKPVTAPPGGFQQGGFQKDTGGLTTFDLNTGSSLHLDLNCPVLTVSFGADGKALVVCRNPPPVPPDTTLQPSIFLLDPATVSLQTIGTVAVRSRDLPLNPSAGDPPVLLSTAPAQIIQAGAGVSGDLQTIVVLAAPETDGDATSNKSVLIRYSVATHAVASQGIISTPPNGPRSVSVDQTGANAMAGWSLARFGQSLFWA